MAQFTVTNCFMRISVAFMISIQIIFKVNCLLSLKRLHRFMRTNV